MRDVEARGYRGLVLVGRSDLDLIVEHACVRYEIEYVQDDRKDEAAGRGGRRRDLAETGVDWIVGRVASCLSGSREIVAAFLFGSAATGRLTAESDIDVAVHFTPAPHGDGRVPLELEEESARYPQGKPSGYPIQAITSGDYRLHRRRSFSTLGAEWPAAPGRVAMREEKLQAIKDKIRDKQYRVTVHALERRIERKISLSDMDRAA